MEMSDDNGSRAEIFSESGYKVTGRKNDGEALHRRDDKKPRPVRAWAVVKHPSDEILRFTVSETKHYAESWIINCSLDGCHVAPVIIMLESDYNDLI